LHPGGGGDELSCDLEAANVNQAERGYVALSYVWGGTTNITSILCNGKPMQVTHSLAEALRGIRDPVTPKRLWADAICIDQTNNNEKNQQVRRMGTIYAGAKNVIVWLGNDADDIAEDCFHLICSTNYFLDQQLAKYGSIVNVPTIVEPYPICNDPLEWDKVRKLLSFSWFTRVWVIQEVGLARECTLRWGSYELDFAQLMELALWQVYREDVAEIIGHLKVLRLTDLFRDIHCSYNETMTWRKNLPLIRAEAETYTSQLFLDVLLAASGMGATDKRDHVFAFLGSPLAYGPDGKLLVEPNYDIEVQDVYHETACSCLRHPREAPYVFSRVKHSIESLEDLKIPSWVPRWDSYVEFSISRPHFWYRAGGDGDFRPSIRRNRTVVAQGIDIGYVAFTSRTIQNHNIGTDPDAWDEEYRVARKPFIDFLWEWTLHATKPATTQLEKEFAWTLVRAYPATPGKTCDSQYMAEFAAYRRLVRTAAKSGENPEGDQQSVSDQEAYPRNILHRLYYCDDMRVTILESGQLGLVPYAALPGDCCCILPGVPVPMILRRLANNTYRLVGESYISGVMEGEIMESLTEARAKEETFTIT
jgi:hypothetical protein